MSDKVNIKELFQKELGNYKAKVDPGLWNGIQAGLGSAGAGSSIGLAGKIIIGASMATAITVGSILFVNNNKNSTTKNEKLQVENTTNTSNEGIEKESEGAITIQNKDTKQSKTTQDSDQTKIDNKVEKQNKENFPRNTVITEDENIIGPPVLPEKVNEVKKASENNSTTPQYPKVNSNEESAQPQTEDNTKLIANLSKVEISISEQNNQFVSFSAKKVPEGATIDWNFGDGDNENSLNPEHFYMETGKYNVHLTVTKDHQKVTKTIPVSIEIKGEIGTLSNVFTPNEDGDNDVFFIESKHLKSFQLTIMDKNQNVVYSTNNPNFKWKGLDKYDQPVKEGNYIYIIVAEDESGNTINKYQKLTIQR